MKDKHIGRRVVALGMDGRVQYGTVKKVRVWEVQFDSGLSDDFVKEELKVGEKLYRINKRLAHRIRMNESVIGTPVAKVFEGVEFYGKVTKHFKGDGYWHIEYTDDDSEDFDKEELMGAATLYHESIEEKKRKDEVAKLRRTLWQNSKRNELLDYRFSTY